MRKKSILLLLVALISAGSLFAQNIRVQGVIVDKKTGEALIGSTVIQKGAATNGTATGLNGDFTLSVPSNSVLVVSYVGYISQEVKVAGNSPLRIQLEEENKALDEVVVIGYGTSKKVDLTGSIGSVNSDAILKQPSLNAVQSIQGKVSGINIINNDAPGSVPTVVVRGLGTALGGRNPLYIVDGFPVENIQNINSSDIQSMDILKDASSASIYGVRAANGVILITTKKGQTGVAKINVETYFGIKSVQNKVKMANASQYIEYFNENQKGVGASWSLANAASQSNNTNWYDELTSLGHFNNNVISLSGGSKIADYFFSYNYYDEDGVLDNQKYQRSTIRNNNVFKFFNDRLKFNENMNISFSNENPKQYGAFDEAYRQSPLVPTKYSNGRYGVPFVNTTTGVVGYDGSATDVIGSLNSVGNPLLTTDNYNENKKNLTIQGGIEGEFKLTDYLKVNSRFGATKYYSKDRQFSDIKNAWLNVDPRRSDANFDILKSANPSATTYADNSLRYEDIETFRWIWEGYATFNKDFDKHHIEAVVGLSREKTGIGSTSILKGYDVPAQSQYWNVGMASGSYAKEVDQYSYTPRALASYFGRLQYNYDNKYYLSGTIRRDGSSVFKANGNYWGTFPSVGLGWTISRESFLSDVKFLDHLKLRGTWGKLGNQEVPLNVSQTLTSTGSSNYNYVFGPDQALIYGAAFGTPAIGLTWEVTKETGVGVDYALFGQRLSGSIDYYSKINTNTILNVTPISDSEYSDKYYAHGAKISNKGIELSLSWNDKFSNGLTYNVSANYSYNKNEVASVTPTFDGATGGSLANGQVTKRLQKGEPIYAWWMYEADGVWQNQSEIDTHAHVGSPKPGYLKYKDQNNDGVIDDRDKKFFGSYLPTSNYGIHVGLGYKKIDLSVDGYGVAGNKVYNGLKGTRVDGGENIAYDTYQNRWTGEGSTNTNPGAAHDSYASNYYLESGAFFRINNITLGYTLNDLAFKGSKLRFYVTAQNPFIMTKYSGFSPEISSDGDPSKTSGIELSAYPTTRSFIFGLNLQF